MYSTLERVIKEVGDIFEMTRIKSVISTIARNSVNGPNQWKQISIICMFIFFNNVSLHVDTKISIINLIDWAIYHIVSGTQIRS